MATFHCQRCGHCCEGKGGIVLGQHDMARLCQALEQSQQLTRNEVISRYTVQRQGKFLLAAMEQPLAPSGFACVFYLPGQGCGIHEARPNVCRAWPYFRGNLIDPISFALACEDCPGLTEWLNAEHSLFAAEGFAYLEKHALLASCREQEGNALWVKAEELPPIPVAQISEPQMQQPQNPEPQGQQFQSQQLQSQQLQGQQPQGQQAQSQQPQGQQPQGQQAQSLGGTA